MGKPDYDSAKVEIINAISSLNMKPMNGDVLHSEEYVSDTVHWVGHAVEHLNAAYELIKEGKL